MVLVKHRIVIHCPIYTSCTCKPYCNFHPCDRQIHGKIHPDAESPGIWQQRIEVHDQPLAAKRRLWASLCPGRSHGPTCVARVAVIVVEAIWVSRHGAIRPRLRRDAVVHFVLFPKVSRG